jgi:hypothetical protein
VPLDAAGNYVSLTATEREVAIAYMTNLIRAGGMTDREIVNAAGTRFGWGNEDFLNAFGLLRTSHREVDAAAAATANPGVPPNPSDIPGAPSDPQYWGMFLYDVLIVWTDPATGERRVVREQMAFPAPVSANDITALVIANAPEYAGRCTTPGAAGCDTANWNLDVHILGVSRGR